MEHTHVEEKRKQESETRRRVSFIHLKDGSGNKDETRARDPKDGNGKVGS